MRTILLIAAHPDDTEFGAGGCVARWTGAGDRVAYVICTNGDKGTSDPTLTSQRLAAIREVEQKEAARALGVEDIVFLGHPDGEIEYTRETRGEIVREIRRFRPDIVLTTDPLKKSTWHHDHRVCGQLVLDAVYPYARDRLFYPEHAKEGLLPHTVREVYLWGSDEPDFFIDITDTFEAKIAALKCHQTQVGKRSDLGLRETVGQRSEDVGQKLGVKYAEQFRRIVLRA